MGDMYSSQTYAMGVSCNTYPKKKKVPDAVSDQNHDRILHCSSVYIPVHGTSLGDVIRLTLV